MSKVSTAPKLADMQYRIVKALGTGAGSTILLVADTKTNERFALKVVKRQDATDDVYIAQAVHEFEVARKLHHPNLLSIYDCRVKRSWFRVSGVELLMEYIDGRTLDEIELPERGQLVLIFIHVAAALNHMHRRGVFHGDLKPGNIMLSRDGSVKVIDFGTAWIRGEAKDRIQGTPQYMAPEQASEKTVDERTDLYNLGATMYRMFTGHHANLGLPANANGTLGSRSRPKPPVSMVPDFPGTLSEAIMTCLDHNPDKRPAGAFEVKNQLIAVARYMGLRSNDLRGSEDEDD